MPTAPKVTPPRPRVELATTTLPPHVLQASTYYRLVDLKFPSPLYWSKTGYYRFDSPTARWGVCYTAQSIASVLQERIGDAVRKGDVDYNDLSAWIVWSITVPPDLQTIELAGATLTRIRATVQSFVSRYSLSQEWARELMNHPANFDGLVYLGRRCGKNCLALFGDTAAPRPYQEKLSTYRHGHLVEWNEFWRLCDELKISFGNLPSTRPNPTWRLPK
jgi:hypothetical protein